MSLITLNQFLPGFVAADAIGNQAAALHRLALGLGWQARLYTTQPSLRADVPTQPYQTYMPKPGDVNLLHFGIGSELDGFLCAQPAPFVLYHHNITPPDYLAPYNPASARQAQLGRDHLPALIHTARCVWAASAYNADELKVAGYTGDVIVLPPVLGRSATRDRIASSDPIPDAARWLFVGRLVPNKGQDALIRAFAYYHRHINAASKLILVGAARTAPGYDKMLWALAHTLGVAGAVQMGPATEQELAAHYLAAHTFVCLSQHEGFCVPLIEAMNAGLPIVALARTAVIDTLGQAGVLLESAHPALVAETVHVLLTQPELRQQVIAAQHQRAQAFAQPVVEAQAKALLQRLATV